MKHLTRTPKARAGFTMVEVMLAIGIFAVGIAAVAAVFPVAIKLQQNAVEAVEAEQVVRNDEAVVRAVLRIKESALVNYTFSAPFTQVGEGGYYWVGSTFQHDFHYVKPLSAVPTIQYQHLEDRSYPKSIPDPEKRDFYKTVLIQDYEAKPWSWTAVDPDPATVDQWQDWRLYVFVLRRHEGTDYPRTIGDEGLPTGLTPPEWWHYWFDGSFDPAVQAIINMADLQKVPGVCKVSADHDPYTMPPNRVEYGADWAGYNDIKDPDPSDDRFPLVSRGDTVLDQFGNKYKVAQADKLGFSVMGRLRRHPDDPPPGSIWMYEFAVARRGFRGTAPDVRLSPYPLVDLRIVINDDDYIDTDN